MKANQTRSPRLLLQEFRWVLDEKEIIVPFLEGLNVLHGRTQKFRTVFLRLIRYALGGNAKRIDANIMERSGKGARQFVLTLKTG